MTDSPHARAQPATTQLRITLLGPPQLTVLGTPLPLPRRQLRALLYRLAVALQPVSRAQLGFLLWPDLSDAVARRNMTVLLNQLRQMLPPALVRTQRDAVGLDPAGVYVGALAQSLAQYPPTLLHNDLDDRAYSVRTVTLKAGDMLAIPSMVWHNFKNVGAIPGKFIVIHSPAVMEQLIREIAQPIADPLNPPKPAGPPSDAQRQHVMGMIGKYMEMLPSDKLVR